MKKIFTIALFLIAFQNFAQKEAWNWYFGNGAGLNFSSGNPVALTNGVLYTTEGVASISDPSGNLLFYTEGDTIWNRNHVPMTNGTALLGHNSSTQSAIIIPKPGSSTIYYVFTVDAQAGDGVFPIKPNVYGGVAYSEVDMTLSGGLGAVTATKNIQLVTPALEKLTGVKHCNNTDVWVLCQKFNSPDIYAYLVTSSGVSSTPVISSVGRNIYDQFVSVSNDFNEETQGYMKVSPSGTKIAMAHRWHGKIDLHNFNNSTGQVTGHDSITMPGSVYGLEFSPDGTRLYASYTFYDNFIFGMRSNIIQFDMTQTNSAAIQASGIQVGTMIGYSGALQLGPNGKVYISKLGFGTLDAINTPNVLGTGCNYVVNAVNLAGRIGSGGLPTFIQSYFVAPINLVSSITTATNVSCFGGNTGSAAVNVVGGSGNYTYSWLPSGGTGQTGIGLSAGTYTVIVSDFITGACASAGGSTTATITITQPSSAVNATIVSVIDASCGNTNGSTKVSGSGGTNGYTYSWSNDSTSSTISNLAAGAYIVTVTDANGCTAVSTANINNIGAAVISVQSLQNNLCHGDSSGSVIISASAGTGVLTYSWSNGSIGQTVNDLPAGNYAISVTDAAGCMASSSITITEPPLLSATTTSTNANCGTTSSTVSVNVTGGTGVYTYLWTGGATLPTVNGLGSGTYSVTVTDSNGCIATSQASINNNGVATLSVSGAGTICIGQSTTIDAMALGGTPLYTYSWSDGLIGAGPHTVSPTATKIYTVAVTDANNCTSSVYSITITVNPQLVLNVDNSVLSVCSGSSATITAIASGGSNNYTYKWLPGGETTNTINVSPTSLTTYTVSVDDNCSSTISPATIVVNVNPVPTVDLSANITSGCETPLCVQFTGSSSGSCNSSFWDFGNGDTSSIANPTNCYNTQGSFNVSYKCTDINGCSATQTYSNFITVNAKPLADFTYTPMPAIVNQPVNFTDKTNAATAWFWNFNDLTSGIDNNSIVQNPIYTFQDTGIYCIQLTASLGQCMDSIVKCIKVEDVCTLPDSIPNVFSPNNDSRNDLFIIKSKGLSELICSVYNRWGMKIYEYNAIKAGWDGRTFTDLMSPDGTYYYLLDATCIDGRKKEKYGFVTLVR